MSGEVFGEAVAENLKQMEQWEGSLAVVTGATVGIGAAISVKLVKAGINVVGVGRRLDLLEELGNSLAEEKGQFHPKQCDLTNEGETVELFQWIEETLGPISILINNAGILQPTTLKAGESEMWKATIDTNIIALCVCTREALKSMKKHGIDGQIIHMGSITGHYIPDIPLAEPMLNVYPATKHAIVAVTETLRKEFLRIKSKIKVSCISPGVVESELYRDVPAEALGNVDDIPKLKSEDVANACVYILSTPPDVQIQDLMIRAFDESV